jgi:hypothetical protein
MMVIQPSCCLWPTNYCRKFERQVENLRGIHGLITGQVELMTHHLSRRIVVDADTKIDQLKRQLSRQSLGPVAVISDRAASSLRSILVSVVSWLRQVAYDRPFVTLLLAFQAGYGAARLARGYARH